MMYFLIQKRNNNTILEVWMSMVMLIKEDLVGILTSHNFSKVSEALEVNSLFQQIVRVVTLIWEVIVL